MARRYMPRRRSRLVGLWPVGLQPGCNIVGEPDAPLREFGQRLREAGLFGDLVYTLATDAAEADADLVGADQDDGHTHDYRRWTSSASTRWLCAVAGSSDPAGRVVTTAGAEADRVWRGQQKEKQ
jgi:hypothetical protein